MSTYLMEREKTELLKTTQRLIAFPDGEERWIKMFNLHWRWYDRLVQYGFGPEEKNLLNWAILTSKDTGKDLDESLQDQIEHTLWLWEKDGIDVTETDADIMLSVAHKKMSEKRRNRNSQNTSKEPVKLQPKKQPSPAKSDENPMIYFKKKK